MNKIAHISDLHFGDASRPAVDALLAALQHHAPDIVIVTGDLTQSGRKKEFEEAYAFLSSILSAKLVIPGNHDVPVRNLWARFTQPYDRFQRIIDPETDPVFVSEKLIIVGLNSARRAALDVNWSYGCLSRRQIEAAAARLSNAHPEALKTIATHHPFVKSEGRAGARIVGRGNEALQRFAAQGLDVVFTGHVHRSKAELVSVGERSIIVVQAGTASSGRLRGESLSFNLVNSTQERVEVTRMERSAGAFTPDGTTSFVKNGDCGWSIGSA